MEAAFNDVGGMVEFAALVAAGFSALAVFQLDSKG